MPYSPKYVNLNDVPVQIPDEFDSRQKQEALEIAESELEADVNNGERLDPSNNISIVRTAIKQKATCELLRGATHHNEVKLGDLEQGDGRLEYAQSFCQAYEDLIAKILKRGLLDDSGPSNRPYSYTTSPPAGSRHSSQEHRFPSNDNVYGN